MAGRVDRASTRCRKGPYDAYRLRNAQPALQGESHPILSDKAKAVDVMLLFQIKNI